MNIVTTKTADIPVKSIFGDLPKNIICFSHLRWDFVFQRPQHLLTRFASGYNVFYIEEPVFDAVDSAHYSYLNRGEHVVVVVPHLPPGLNPDEIKTEQKNLLDRFMEKRNVSDCTFWYYTPMALEFSKKYVPKLTVFDCMDELSAFKFAPEELKNLEKELLQKADIVFTGGCSLYEAKKNQHANIYAFPSSIDKQHFLKVRDKKVSRANTSTIKLGFYGVIDERFDIDLIRGIADERPDWQIELIGPVVKIDPATLPKNSNISYPGSKSYQELPDHMATWDIALIPFLLNESTRFISPTKTPEYLAAGLPVVSTPIKDVINPYGKKQLVQICANADGFVEACEKAMSSNNKQKWLQNVDDFLEKNSWDITCDKMLSLMQETINRSQYISMAQ